MKLRLFVSISLMTIAGGAAGFAILADAASEGDGVTRIDPEITRLAVRDRTSGMTIGAHMLTALGSEVVVSALAIFTIMFLLNRHRVTSAAAVGIAMAGSAAMTVGFKLAIGRDRPGAHDRLGPADTTYSFPSGHTLNSAVLIGVIAVLVVPLISRSAVRTASVIGLALVALGIGASRVYLGYHWATDVIASWVLGLVWVAAIALAHHLLSVTRGSQVAFRSAVR